MIEKYTLKLLLEEYNIDSAKLIHKNNNILTYGEYQKIKATLDYLINDLKVDTKNIEKCPSILYRNPGEINSNINFLQKNGVKFQNIETCLHVLSTESQQLSSTYEYVKENYGIDVIDKVTSILAVSKNKIISIEKLNIPLKNKNDIISIAIGRNGVKEIQEIINSAEFKEYPELFTSQVLAHASLKKIQEIINSSEFKEHPELFTSEVLAHASLEEIQEIINSSEYKEHPELFTSTVLAHARLKEIQSLLELPYWENPKYKALLTPVIVSLSKSMLKKLPVLFQLAEDYEVSDHLNTSFLRKSPSQNYALINYLVNNKMNLVVNGKLNMFFSLPTGTLKKKYNIDINQLMREYPMTVEEKEKEGRKL